MVFFIYLRKSIMMLPLAWYVAEAAAAVALTVEGVVAPLVLAWASAMSNLSFRCLRHDKYIIVYHTLFF